MSTAAPNDIWAALSSQTADLADRTGKSVVAVNAGHRVAASGVHWRPGIVVTAAHLVRRADEVSVILPNGTGVKGAVAGLDATTDLAAIKLAERGDIPTATLGTGARVGEFVLAVARSGRGELSASAGIMARVGERWRTWRGGEVERLLRPDVRLYPGQSGSALVNGRGEVLGINSSVLARESVITLPVPTVDRVLSELLERGHIARPYLGVAMQPVALPAEWQVAAGTQQGYGLLVMHVQPDGPAQKAGISLGDVLISVGGVVVEDFRELQRHLAMKKTGEPLTVRLLRSGKALDVTVDLGDRPRR
jgi:S1-C subfamily serine protease